MEKRELPDWEKLYQHQTVETMPWFHPELDPDLARALRTLNIQSGTALDLGTGPGTQAMALAEKGFNVTASDLSDTAVKKAIIAAREKNVSVTFIQDDILNSQLDKKFDFLLDRGCFHILDPDRRSDYVRTVSNLIEPKGYLFLKCFSHLETIEKGPYRFTPAEIGEIFGSRFNVFSIEETVYYGTLDPLPLALFCILQKS